MPPVFHPEEATLSNGIPVIFQNTDLDVAAFYWWNNVGSADEIGNEAGFAHFLEHMLFKDANAKETGMASTGQTARKIESLGGDINAYTTYDQTVYHVTSAAQHMEKVIDEFGKMAAHQKFLKVDFDREREVILEELRKNEDSPDRQLFQDLISQTFKKHPYGRPIIGFSKTLKAAKVNELESFYRCQYVPSKMGLVVVGPIDDAKGARKKKILQVLEKRFGSHAIPRRSGRMRNRPTENLAYPDVRMHVRKFDVKTPSLTFAFRVPGLRHEDIPGLDLLSSVLGMGELSRLYQKVFHERSLVTEVSSGIYIPGDYGLFTTDIESDTIDLQKDALKATLEEFSRLKTQGPTQEELDRVLASAESERVYSTQTVDGIASRIGYLRFILNDLNFDQKLIAKMKALQADDFQELAEKTFTLDRMAVAGHVPEATPDTKEVHQGLEAVIRESLGKRTSQAKPSLKLVPSSHSADLWKHHSGIRVAYRERKDAETFSVQLYSWGGVRLELAQPFRSHEKDWGGSNLLAQVWTKGTSNLSSKEIAAIVEGSAAGLSGFSGKNSVGLTLSGLAKDFEKLSQCLLEVALDPVFPEDEIKHSKRVIEDGIRSIEDHSGQLCSMNFMRLLFEHHPYGHINYGSLETLPYITRDHLKNVHKRWIQPGNLVVSIVGKVSRNQVNLFVEALSARFGKDHSSFDLPKVLDEPALKAPRWIEKKVEREQAHIIIGGLGLSLYSPERHTLQVLETILGGQSGRLFIELREKKSLAYSVSPMSFEGVERGYAATYIGCAAAKRQEALDGIAKVLGDFAKKGPTSSEMDRARQYLLGRRAMELQTNSSLASHHGLDVLYGLPQLSADDYAKKVNAVSPRQVKELCQKLWIDQPQVTSIVE